MAVQTFAAVAAVLLPAGVSGAAAQLTTSEPYDCKAGYSNRQKGWSSSKKDWCCQTFQLGCKPSGQAASELEEYDCDAAAGNFEAAWSPEKKEWCCERESKGCSAEVTLRLCRGIWEDFDWWSFDDAAELRPTREQEHDECCVVAGRGGCCQTKREGDLCFNETSKLFHTEGSDTYAGFQLLLRGSGLHGWEGLFIGGAKKSNTGYWENITATLIGGERAEGERSLIMGDVVHNHADWYKLCHVGMGSKEQQCCNAVTEGGIACCHAEDGRRLCFREGSRIVNVTGPDHSSDYGITLEDEGCGNYTGHFVGGEFDVPRVDALASTFDACSGVGLEEEEKEEEALSDMPAAPSASSDPHHCLRWHGHGGCDNIMSEQLCLHSRDGRPQRQWKDRKVAGQPCAWCGGEVCTSTSDALCMPADWVKGRPNTSVANCSGGRKNVAGALEYAFAGAPDSDFEKSYKSSQCGLKRDGGQDDEKPYFTFTAESTDMCKALCASHEFCAGVDFSKSGESGVCKVWWHSIESVKAAPGHECVKVKGVPGAGNMTGIPALWEHLEYGEDGPCSAPSCDNIPARPAVVPNGCPWGQVGAFCVTTVTRATTSTTTSSTRTTRAASTASNTMTNTTETMTKTTMTTTRTHTLTTTNTTTTETIWSSTTTTSRTATTTKMQPTTTTTGATSTTATSGTTISSTLTAAATETTTEVAGPFLGGGGPGPGDNSEHPDDAGADNRELVPAPAPTGDDSFGGLDGGSATIPGADAAASPDGGDDPGVPHSVNDLTIDTVSDGMAFEEAPAEEETPTEAPQAAHPAGLSPGEQAAIGVSAGVAGAALLGGLLGGLLGTTATTTTSVAVLIDDGPLGGNQGSENETQTATWTTTSNAERALLVVTTAAESGAPVWLLAAAAAAAVAAGLGFFAYARGLGSKRGVQLRGEGDDEESASSSGSGSGLDETASPHTSEIPLSWPRFWPYGSAGRVSTACAGRLLRGVAAESALGSPALDRSRLPSSPIRYPASPTRASQASSTAPSPGVPPPGAPPVLAPFGFGGGCPPPARTYMGPAAVGPLQGAALRPLEPWASRDPTPTPSTCCLPVEPVAGGLRTGGAPFAPR